ncbi:unnamed protein product, partial [marine sediment metagenome]
LYLLIKNKYLEKNISVVCKSCNSSKGAKDFIDWMEFKKLHIKPYLLTKYLEMTKGS